MTAANSVVTITTDFGTRDWYVGAMKGAVYRAQPGTRIVDLSHDIAPGDVMEGALFLSGVVPSWPAGTVHLVVIDPGVGTDRLPVAVHAGNQYFVLPDNGLLTLVLETAPLREARSILLPDAERSTCSATFHGRDLFAPTAARLAGGMPLADAGPRIDGLIRLDLPRPQRDANDRLAGAVIHVDHFGNCITNIAHHLLPANAAATVQAGSRVFPCICRTYGDAAPGQALALIGSTGRLEIAVRNGSAAERLGLSKGDAVSVSR